MNKEEILFHIQRINISNTYIQIDIPLSYLFDIPHFKN